MLHAQEILNLKKRLTDIYARHTGQPLKKIEDALERDTFLTAVMAKDFGLVDEVIEKRPVEDPASDSGPADDKKDSPGEPMRIGPPGPRHPTGRFQTIR